MGERTNEWVGAFINWGNTTARLLGSDQRCRAFNVFAFSASPREIDSLFAFSAPLREIDSLFAFSTSPREIGFFFAFSASPREIGLAPTVNAPVAPRVW